MADSKNGYVERLMEQAKIYGVASAKVTDGHIYIFSKESMEGFLKAAEESGENTIIIHVKNAPTLEESRKLAS